jgi:hypothetical protein
MKNKFDIIINIPADENKEDLPLNKALFEKMEEYRNRIKFCSQTVRENFYDLYEDKYNFDDVISSSEGEEAYERLFKGIENDLQNRENLLIELKNRLSDETMREYLKTNTDIIDHKGVNAYNVIKGDFESLEKADLDLLSKIKLELNDSDYNKEAVLDEIDKRRREKFIIEKKIGKKERVKLIKELHGFILHFPNLSRLMREHLDLQSVLDQNSLKQLKTEELQMLNDLCKKIERKAIELGGNKFDEEDLILGFEELRVSF